MLLDAPCSSTGTIRRHPDVAWTKTPDDIEKLAALQLRMLARAAELVKPGGTVVFSNCSLDPREGEHVAEAAIASGSLVADPIREGYFLDSTDFVTPEGWIRTIPAGLRLQNARISGLDGFFASRFKRPA